MRSRRPLLPLSARLCDTKTATVIQNGSLVASDPCLPLSRLIWPGDQASAAQPAAWRLHDQLCL